MKIRHAAVRPTRTKTVITVALFLIWALLIAFAFVAAGDPPWLKSIAQYGRADESRGMKDYGDGFLRQKNYSMAIAQYLKALEIKPDYVGALANLAMAYTNSGNSEQALKILQDALKLKSVRTGPIYFNIAEILAGQGKRAEAIEYYLKAIGSEIEPDLIYRKLGVLYLETGETEKALAAFESTLQLQRDARAPYYNMVRMNLALYEDDNENLPVLKTMLDYNLNRTALDKYDLLTVEILIGRDPEVAKTHNYLGSIYSQRGEINKAIDHYKHSYEIWPTNSEAAKQLDILIKIKK